MTPNAVTIRRSDGPLLVGILGGMGPAATADFYAKLVRETPASKDQDHLPTVIWADPTVPDRSDALLEGGTDPTPHLIHGAKMLSRCGANLIAMPCNAVHAFLPAMEEVIDVPIISMIETTVQALTGAIPPFGRVGLLATDATLNSGLYRDLLRREHMELLIPTTEDQRELMTALRAIKAGDMGPKVQKQLSAVASGLVYRGADALIAGCTEVLLGLSSDLVSVPVIDPAETLAQRIVAISCIVGDHRAGPVGPRLLRPHRGQTTTPSTLG